MIKKSININSLISKKKEKNVIFNEVPKKKLRGFVKHWKDKIEDTTFKICGYVRPLDLT